MHTPRIGIGICRAVAVWLSSMLAAALPLPSSAGSGTLLAGTSIAPETYRDESLDAVPAPASVFVDFPSANGLGAATAHASISGGARRSARGSTLQAEGSAAPSARAAAFRYAVADVPEPGTGVMWLAGLAGMAVFSGRRRSRRHAATVAAMFLVVAGNANADPPPVPGLYTNVGVELSSLNADDDRLHDSAQTYIQGPVAGTIRDSSHLMRSDLGAANASAYAGYGVLGAVANVSARSAPSSRLSPSGSGGTAKSGAHFLDVLQIDSPLHNGQRGTLIVPWALSGGWGGGLTGPFPRNDNEVDVEWGLHITTAWTAITEPRHVLSEVRAWGEFHAIREVNVIEHGSDHRVGSGPLVEDSQAESGAIPPIWSEISIIFGRPVSLDVSLTSSILASASNDGIDPDDPGYLQLRTADGFADFAHTLRWGGVQQVLDANGIPISGWSIEAQSGTDYAVANTTVVPEPATWLSMLLGLLVVTWGPAQRCFRRCVR